MDSSSLAKAKPEEDITPGGERNGSSERVWKLLGRCKESELFWIFHASLIITEACLINFNPDPTGAVRHSFLYASNRLGGSL